MYKRIAFVLLALTVVLSAFASGCAPASDDSSTPSAPANDEESTPAAPAAPSDEVIRWRVQGPLPPGFGYYEAEEAFTELVADMSGGRLEMQLFSGGGIVPAYEELEATESGTLDACFTTASDAQKRYGPVTDLFGQYVAGPTVKQFYMWFHYGGGAELAQEMYSDANVKWIGLATAGGAEDELWSNKPIRSVEDLQGLKIRTYGAWGQILAKLGAAVVSMPSGEIFTAMERGVIDGFEAGPPGIDVQLGFHEICDYVHEPGVHSPGVVSQMLINNDAYDKLPGDLREIVRVALGQNFWDSYLKLQMADIEAMQIIKDTGVEIVELPIEFQADIVLAADEFWAELAAEDEFAAEVIESQKTFFDAYGSLSSIAEPDLAAVRAHIG